MVDPIAKLLGEWSNEITIGSIFLKIVLSIVLSAIIGWERSNKRHSAGLRTFILLTLASTIAMMIDQFINDVSGTCLYIIAASTIVASAIISGNTTLYTSRNQIKGLTTSVGLWGCGILGLTIGVGYYTVAIIFFFALEFILAVFPKLEFYLKNRSNHFEIHLELKNASFLKDFVTTIRELGLKIDDIETNPAYVNSGLSVYSISFSISSQELKKYKSHSEIIQALKTLEYVYYIEEMN